MPSSIHSEYDTFAHNRAAWNQQAALQCPWSQPVTPALIAAAKTGQWQVHLTPKPVPSAWLGDVCGMRILALASAGGQQAPTLAAAGAAVTVFDASSSQLDQDRYVAERDGLELTLIEGDMRDLSCLDDASFDLIFHPISNLYVPDIKPVWQECHRVLRHGGSLLASFYNPAIFIGDRDPNLLADGLIKPRHTLPYSDLRDLAPAALDAKRQQAQALVFGHTLSEQLGGQIEAGFVITGFYEDSPDQPRFLLERYMASFIATRAIKT